MAIISSLSKGVGSSSTALKCGAAVVVSAATVGVVLTCWDGLTDGAEGSELVASQDPEEDEGDVEEVSVQQDTTEWWWKNDNVNAMSDAVEELQKELMADVDKLLSEHEIEEPTFAWESADYYYQDENGEIRKEPWVDARENVVNAQDVVPAVFDGDVWKATDVWSRSLWGYPDVDSKVNTQVGARKVVFVDTKVNVWKSQERTANGTLPELREIVELRRGEGKKSLTWVKALGVVEDMARTDFGDRLWSSNPYDVTLDDYGSIDMEVVTLDDLLTSHHQ